MMPSPTPFVSDDLQALHEAHGTDRPQPVVDRVLTQPSDEEGEDLLWRAVVRDGRGVSGYGYLARSAWHPPRWYQTEVFVRPDARGAGVGAALVDAVLARARAHGAESVTTWADGKHPGFVRFAERHGFREVQRFVTMTLRVADADEALLYRHLEAARQAGFSLFSFEDTLRTPEAQQKLYALNRRLAPLLPGNGDEFPTFEEYRREILEADWFRPHGQLVAARGDEWVGLVGLGFHEGRSLLTHEFTAVAPEVRGQGVAKALKAWSVLLAREWGIAEIKTGNDATNAPIIGVNRSLGYTLEPGVVKLRRTMTD